MGFALANMQVTSAAFTDRQAMPARHTGEGEDVSPALGWSGAPSGTQGYAVICHDPDAPLVLPMGTYGFVHWVLYNIPGSVTGLEEGTRAYTEGYNDMGNVGYNGPMPPEGHGVHAYYFWVLALSEATSLESGLTMWQLLERLEPKILGMNRLVGTYTR